MHGDIFRVCGIALLCSIAVLVVRQSRPDMGIPVRIAGCIAMVAVILSAVQPILDYARELMGEGGMASYGEVALRALGIALLTHICACICRDCGENTIATMTEVGGKVAILLLCLPLLREIVQGISELI